MKFSPRLLLVCVATTPLILILNTCGIEQIIPQLNPPSNPVELGSTFEFTKTTDNSEVEFIGFDLYYRMYQRQDTPDPNAIIEFEDLGANGFHRIHDSEDSGGHIEWPLIRVQLNDRTPGASPPDNDEFDLTVDFTGIPSTLDLVDPYPLIFDDGNPDLIDSGDTPLTGPVPILIEITDIRRDVHDSSSDSYKRFSDFSSEDDDIKSYPGVWSDINNGYAVKIVLYVVSYGYDIVNYRALRSEPVKLGEIDRTFP